MATRHLRSRSGLGRPPLPEDERKDSLTCYLPVRVIERLGELAERQRVSRNKLAARVLSDFVAGAEAGAAPPPSDGRQRAAGG